MQPLDVIFWLFAASVVAFIGWSFLRMLVESLSDRRHRSGVKRHTHAASAADGISSGSDTATLMTASGDGSAIGHGNLGSSGESGGGESGGGDFSGGGGDSGGGGSSGGW